MKPTVEFDLPDTLLSKMVRGNLYVALFSAQNLASLTCIMLTREVLVALSGLERIDPMYCAPRPHGVTMCAKYRVERHRLESDSVTVPFSH